MNLYEILVPTKYGDTLKPIRTRHHKEWDKLVRKITGGLTILTPARGQWVHNHDVYEERVIPVRVMCSGSQMAQIVRLTLRHYRQIGVMSYLLSTECYVTYGVGNDLDEFER